MHINGFTKIYGLLGYPAKHSLSPLIQNYLFEKNNLNSVYHVFEISPEEFAPGINCLKVLGVEGFNLTMPFKSVIIPLLGKVDKDARILNSVNTVVKRGKIYSGYNTDISGAARCLFEKNFDFENSSALIIGAGSTARSIILALLKNNIYKLSIYNRTISKALDIKDIVNKFFNKEITVLNDINDITINEQKKINLIINSTTIGMEGAGFKKGLPIPGDWDLKDKYIFEVIYNPIETELILKAKSEKAVIITGLDMLVNQAIDAFEIWTGIHPDKNDLLKYFRKALIKKY